MSTQPVGSVAPGTSAYESAYATYFVASLAYHVAADNYDAVVADIEGSGKAWRRHAPRFAAACRALSAAATARHVAFDALTICRGFKLYAAV